MKRREFLRNAALATTACLIAGRSSAQPQVHVVEMMRGNLFSPKFLEANVGDIVRFVNVSGSHNSESIPGMIPDGVAPWKSKLRKTFELQLKIEGVYGYKCTPHYQKGMVGLIVVGNPSGNLTQAMSVKTPTGAQLAFDSLFMQAKAISLAY